MGEETRRRETERTGEGEEKVKGNEKRERRGKEEMERRERKGRGEKEEWERRGRGEREKRERSERRNER